MAKSKGKTSDAVEILHRRYTEKDPEMAARVRQERENLSLAQQLYDLRSAVGLTQQQLAERVGTTASVICRLEDADYDGHSLNMLRRVAAAMNCRVDVRLHPLSRENRQRARRGAEHGVQAHRPA